MERHHLLWVLVTRAEDMPGTWLARVLDFGLTTQADSIEEAFEMAQDALRLAIVSDIEKGLDPFQRQRAAPEYWEALEKLLSSPKRSRLGDLSPEQRTRVTAVAAQLVVSEVRQFHEMVPMALEPWQVAHLNELRQSCQPS